MGSSSTLSRTHQHGIAVGALCCQSRVRQNVQRPLSIEASAKHSFKRQLHTKPVGAIGAFGWNPTAEIFRHWSRGFVWLALSLFFLFGSNPVPKIFSISGSKHFYLKLLRNEVPRSWCSIHPEQFAFIHVSQQTFSQQVSGTVFGGTSKDKTRVDKVVYL